MTILITGAAGKTGRTIIQALAEKGAPVRALLRRPEQQQPILALGAQAVIIGHLSDPAILRQAVQGARAIYHICPNMHPDEVVIGQAILAAARVAGVEHFVYHSVLHPQAEAMPHHWNKLRIEELLFTSGLPFTILQPTAYMQNLLAGWQQIIQEGVYRVPYPTTARLSLVDLSDVGAVAAKVLTESGHQGATYELVGTPPLSQAEVATLLGQALGRPVRAKAISLVDWERTARAGSALGEYAIATLLQMFRYYEQYGLVGNPNVLRWLLGREPVTVAQFLQQITSHGRIVI